MIIRLFHAPALRGAVYAPYHPYWVVSFDQKSLFWDREVIRYSLWPDDHGGEEKMTRWGAVEIGEWLKKKGYDYFLIDSYFLGSLGDRERREKVQELGKIMPLLYQSPTQSAFVFKVP